VYKVSVFNNGVETVIRYPSSDPEDPQVNKLPFKESLSVVDTLSFALYTNNPGYNKVYELTTKVKVIDMRDNSIRFTGRVLSIDDKMDNDGTVYKDVTCEGALSYLNDTKQRGSTITDSTVAGFLNQMLSIHNSKVEDSKKIYVGNVNVQTTNYVVHSCNYKSTLAELLLTRDDIGGDIRIREVTGLLYLDWLQSFTNTTIDVELGTNMKDMVISKDFTTIGTRIVPLGANNLTIETVNNGVDYIEDNVSKNLYGVIEKTVEYNDIADAALLKSTCIADISKHTQPTYVLQCDALDLSFLTNQKTEQFTLGAKLHIVNPIMGVDAVYTIVELDADLLTPYNPKLTISNKPDSIAVQINDLRNSSIQNNGVYNNVQIGSAFGIRAVRSDNKVITTINATEGMTIQNNNKKVFSIDLDGNIVVNDITANDITANGGDFNDIHADGGTFDDIRANGGTFDDITAINGITIKDDDFSCFINKLGIKLGTTDHPATMTTFANYSSDGSNYEGFYFADDVKMDGTTFVNKLIVSGKIEVDNADDFEMNGIPLDMYIAGVVYEAIKANQPDPDTGA
jgi:hypothetical protein